jgi:hypothetical protein
MSHYSPSQLTLFSQCKRKYQYQYLIHPDQKRKTSPQLERGSLVHKWIEEYLSSDHLPSFSPADLDEKKKERLVSFLDKLKEEKESGRCNYQTELKLGFDSELKLVEFDSERVYFRGICDFVITFPEKKACSILDWKTGKNYQADSLQMKSYIFMFSNLFPDWIYRGFYYYIDRVRDDPLTMIECTNAREDVLSCLSAIKNEKDFNGTPGFYCSYCDWKDECPEQKQGGDLVSMGGMNVLKGMLK